jgi:hypothetical protein
MIRPGSGEVPASPPARFPLWGLDGSLAGPRWLDGVGDGIGEEVRWVRLAHARQETGEQIAVETHSRPLTDAVAARTGEAALASVSFGAAVVLINLTLPDMSVPRLEGLNRALVSHAEEWSKRYAEWTPVTWQVDGTPVLARAWEFAGGWAAFSDALDHVYLAAIGSGGSPDGLALARVRDASAYHFDLEQPVDVRTFQAASDAAWADHEQAWQHSDWHPDQLRLVPGHA